MRPFHSRELLFPGPLSPVSHLGVTLLRHVLGTGLRYSLYQLGFPPPEQPPVTIVRLRPYLDGARLLRDLPATAEGRELVAALLDPGGAPPPESRTPRLQGAARAHGARLRVGLPPRGRFRPPTVRPEEDAALLWRRFLGRLKRRQPMLNDALLGELVAALSRRAQRARGRSSPPALGGEARRFLAGGRPRLFRLGAPDLRLASWADGPDAAPRPAPPGPLPPKGHPLRGRFRESWRQVLDELRPLYRALAQRAADRGLLERPDDAFFVPFDLAQDLTAPAGRSVDWLPSAAAANRRELEAHRELEAPPERLDGPPPPPRVLAAIEADRSPLTPLR